MFVMLFAYIIITIGLAFAGFAIVAISLNVYQSIIEIITGLVFLGLGSLLLFIAFKLFDKFAKRKTTMPRSNLELTAVDVFFTANKLQKNLRQYFWISLAISSILIVYSFLSFSMYFDSPNLAFLEMGIFFLFFYVLHSVFTLFFRYRHNELATSTQKLNTYLNELT